MPLSFRSSLFSFLPCLSIISIGWASTQTALPSDATFPFYNVTTTLCLTSNCKITNLFGAQFDTSFLGADSSFSLQGNKYQFFCSHCQAPTKDNAALISSTGNLTLDNLSKLTLTGNISTGSDGLISGVT